MQVRWTSATMKKSALGVAFLLLIAGLFNECRASIGPCESIAVPPLISTILQKSFPDWRVEKLSDLDSSDQEAWTKKYPTACPGFVAGHVQKQSSVGYAFLLLPSDQTRKGYRLVVFIETTKGHWRSIVLERNDQHTPETAVIGLSQPGDYQEAEGSKKIHTETEGIFGEDLGVGVMIYYWHVDRFRSLVISD
jgi:hypothetical protein